ncbi:MAG TPA: MurR/RpiR family transcriptional regulator [Clostridia bacterium]|nr:MurR/RpiR family transcriptional regulator [Clostridia bacterium]HRX43197.1 MurR/RpiR family transcriptional regulator [Clostridia bacterium]
MPAKFDVKKRMMNSMDSLSKSRKRIAGYILDNFDTAPFMTAARLAEVVNTSESTVVRFAVELGFEGYPEMARAMQEQALYNLTAAQRLKMANDSIDRSDVLKSVLKADISRIKETMDDIDRGTFDGVINKLLTARKIYILGVRSSAALAMYLGFYFNLIFENVNLVQTTSASEVFEQILGVGEGDVIIGISFPRYSKRTSKAMEYAGKKGAYVVAISDSVNSPVAKWADSTLVARSDMTSFVDSLTAPLSVINALIVAVGLKREDKVLGTLKTLEKIWDEYQVYEKEDSN